MNNSSIYPPMWKDSFKNMIPSSDVFSLGWSNEIEVVDSKNMTEGWAEGPVFSGKEYTFNVDPDGAPYPPGTEYFIVLSNVGYYNGQPLYVKVTVTSDFKIILSVH